MHEPLSKARGVRGVSATSDSDGVADGWRSRWKRFALRIFRNLGSKVGTRKCAPPEFHTSRGSPKLIKIDKKGGRVNPSISILSCVRGKSSIPSMSIPSCVREKSSILSNLSISIPPCTWTRCQNVDLDQFLARVTINLDILI